MGVTVLLRLEVLRDVLIVEVPERDSSFPRLAGQSIPLRLKRRIADQRSLALDRLDDGRDIRKVMPKAALKRFSA